MAETASGGEASPIGVGARLKQAGYLVLLLLKFKARRLPITIFVLLLMPSNYWLYDAFSRVESATAKSSSESQSKYLVNAQTFSKDWQVLVDTESAPQAATNLQQIMLNSGASKDLGWLVTCNGRDDCMLKYFRQLHAESERRLFGRISYINDTLQLECLDTPDMNIPSSSVCAFLYQLMVQSLSNVSESRAGFFKDVEFVEYLGIGGSPMDVFIRKIMNRTLSDTMCSRSLLNSNFLPALWMTILLHILITTVGVMVNFAATTVTFILGLKENGFLQLMFNSGLSVASYWSVILATTVLESIIFGSVFALCYGLQCPDYFPMGAAVRLLVIFSVFAYCQGAMSLIATVLFQSYFVVVISISAETLLIVAMSAIGVLKLNEDQSKVDIALHGMLIFPPGNIAQYSMYILTPENLRPWSAENKTYLNNILTLMAIFAGVITLLMIYLDFLLASGNGYLLPPTFVFSRGFWWPGRLNAVLMEEDESTDRTPNVEQVVNGVPAILVRNISKRYGVRCNCCCPIGSCSMATLALKSVSCTIYQNQITALIGHNGAGKTTLMRILTGEETPTGGLAIIGGRTVTDPYQRLTLLRQVSICKQENVLSPHLTLAESLQLAVISKGLTMASQQVTIDDMLRRLGLSGKEHVRAVDMSGGQLRKVCCIIALLGNPPVVMLDEPTSGLDPVSRRRLWHILQEHKQGRCIILCTQFMDEADVLADRKLFLSSGQLICAGSSLFLKHLFGCSVVINVSLRSENDAESVLKALGPGVQLVSEAKTELQLSLEPSGASELKALVNAVQVLESDTARVAAFGISQANLDDIFMRLESIDPISLDSALNTKRLTKVVLSSEEVVACRHPSLVGDGLPALQSSVVGTFANLMIMNLRRQGRAPIQFMCRFFMPIAIIAFLGVLVHMEKSKYVANKETVRLLQETDDLVSSRELIVKLHNLLNSEIVRIPVQPWAYNDQLRAICIADNGSMPGDCTAITGNRFSVNPMTKPSSVSLDNYLNQSMTTNAILQKMCYNSCPFVYANNWNSSHPNRDRSVIIGRYGMYMSNRKEQLPSYDVTHSLLEYFGATKSLTKRVRLSKIISLENFQFSQMELMVLVVVFSIIPVTFMTDSVEDRVSRVRHQMYVMGLSGKAYWINMFLIHYMQYIIFALIAMLVCLQWEKYRSLLLLVTVALPMLVAGTVSNILTVYCIGSCQQTTNDSVMTGYFFFIMIFGILSMFVCKSRLAMATCTWLVPPLAPVLLCVSAVKLFTFAMLYFESDNTGDVPGLWTAFIYYPDVWHALAAMPVHIALQLVFLYTAETWNQPAPWLLSLQLRLGVRTSHRGNELEQPTPQEEAGVSEERDRLEQNPRSDRNALEVRGLEKVHPNGVKAVRGVTFGVGPGEIFGLLGQNGAGKTTMMSVIVGETGATSGEVEVRHGDTWIASVDGAKHGAVGYCPQHNPLFNSVTVEEHMLFYAQIRSLPPEMAVVQCYSLMEGLGLGPHQHKLASQLSGGNKRRLCLALALLGSPSIVMIDEASSGVDPDNKRAIWSAIRGMVGDSRRTVVVTTHSMEEVEALCNRVAIINRGVMIGFGTVQQLRSRHGKAFILEALVSTSSGDLVSLAQRKQDLKAAVLERFLNAQVIEDVWASVQFQVPTESVPKLSAGIQWLLENQAKLGVEYFSLHQMSLDQVFVNMMRQHALETGQGEVLD